jgi:hypothetical protein
MLPETRTRRTNKVSGEAQFAAMVPCQAALAQLPTPFILSRMKRAALTLALVFAAAATAFGYGREGHEAVGELARQMLRPEARAAVIQIHGNDNLAGVSTWADELKLAEHHQGPLANNPEAVAVNAQFPANHLWHFADLPLGTEVYRDNDKFSNGNDVVQAITRCIGVLEAAPGIKTDLTKAEALKFLVHLVGDLHQPLHCGCGCSRRVWQMGRRAGHAHLPGVGAAPTLLLSPLVNRRELIERRE